MPPVPDEQEPMHYHIQSMARELTLQDPRVRRIEERHKTRLRKMVPSKTEQES